MTRTAHDSFAKDLLSEMLDKLGQFQAPLEVRDSARQIDAWFVPAESSVEERSKLGLLGAIGRIPLLQLSTNSLVRSSEFGVRSSELF